MYIDVSSLFRNTLSQIFLYIYFSYSSDTTGKLSSYYLLLRFHKGDTTLSYSQLCILAMDF